MVQLEGVMKQGARLVTIEGMAGTGKTELLSAFGRRMIDADRQRIADQRMLDGTDSACLT